MASVGPGGVWHAQRSAIAPQSACQLLDAALPMACHADVLVYRLRTGPELHQQGPCEARLGYQDESHQLGPGTQICHMVLAAPVPAAPVH